MFIASTEDPSLNDHWSGTTKAVICSFAVQLAIAQMHEYTYKIFTEENMDCVGCLWSLRRSSYLSSVCTAPTHDRDRKICTTLFHRHFRNTSSFQRTHSLSTSTIFAIIKVHYLIHISSLLLGESWDQGKPFSETHTNYLTD